MESTLTIPAGPVVLGATLAAPPDPKAVVIFVHGSGPQDRDQNSPGARLNIFNTLAAHLAEMGIASLRYDKRGVGASSGDVNTTGQDDLIADLQACIAWVQSRELGPIYLCGHSEGTAISVAATTGQPVAGMVLLCPYITLGADILRWQATSVEAALHAEPGLKGLALRWHARLMGGPVQQQAKWIKRVLESEDDFITVKRKSVPVRWLRDFLTADVAALYSACDLPMLVMVAARDAQCPPVDGALIARDHTHRRLVEVENLSHLLRSTTVDGFEDYPRQLTQPMDPRVCDLVGDWIKAELTQ